jgi:hypothetical protein
LIFWKVLYIINRNKDSGFLLRGGKMSEIASEKNLAPVLHGFKLEDDYFVSMLKIKILEFFGISAVKEVAV